MKIRFVVDSGCDVPSVWVRQHDMTVVPLYVNMDGESFADDGVGLDRLNYYDRLSDIDPLPQTSAPSIGVAKEMVHTAMEGVEHLVCVTIADKLSNTHNVLRLAAEGLPPERVSLWDSGQLSMGAGWQAIIGAEIAAKSGDVGEVLRVMDRVREQTLVYAALVNLTFLRRGGRISWTQAAVGGLLRIRPIVRVFDGEVNSAAQLRSRRAWVARVASFAREEAPLDRLALLHTNNLEDVEDLREQISDILPETTVTCIASPVIGTHTGPYGIGIATVRETWKD